MQKTIKWVCSHFNDLSLDQLYELMHIRQEVFVVEQDCPYIDADGKDPKGWHLFGLLDEKIVACTRMLPKGVIYTDAISIGRVLTTNKIRRTGAGTVLMEESLKWLENTFPGQTIRMGAQVYLIEFYRRFGFVTLGEEYLDYGIPHIEMLLEKQRTPSL